MQPSALAGKSADKREIEHSVRNFQKWDKLSGIVHYHNQKANYFPLLYSKFAQYLKENFGCRDSQLPGIRRLDNHL